VVEQVLEEISFRGPELADTTVQIDTEYVQQRTSALAADEDLKRFIL
jgi:ATP-dependent protease HslVU (ClpYQ) ATPase subunit